MTIIKKPILFILLFFLILGFLPLSLDAHQPSPYPNSALAGPCDCTSGPIVDIQNGSFEDGPSGDIANAITPPGWIPTNSVDTGNPGAAIACHPNLMSASCDGGQFVGAYSQPSLGNYREGIEQVVNCLVPGTEYMVRFSQAITKTYGFSSGYFEVTFCGATMSSPTMDALSLPYPGFSGWDEIELGPFVATANSHTLRFISISLNDGICPSGIMGTCNDQANGDPTYCGVFFPESDACYVLIDGVSVCGDGGATNCIERACDDGDPCTENDMEEVDECDNVVCVPCAGTPIPECTNTVMRACDDGDPCTENDMEEVDECDNNVVCTPCAGTAVPACANTIMRACDDGDNCTENDMEEIDECNSLVCTPCQGVPITSCTNTIMRACDDGDPCTENDMEEVDECDNGIVCEPCQGVPVAACSVVIERPCDDGDPCTENDMEEVDECSNTICRPCEGVTIDLCQVTVVRPCDDGDPCTTNDVEEVEDCDNSVVCEPCQGVPVDCSNGDTEVVPCDDGDTTTINDVQTILICDNTICIPCQGEPADCLTATTSEIPCDDGDPCTINDMETIVDSTGQICVPCEGIPLDCGGLDICELTRPCDDGDPCTINDMETILLRDSSICVPCLGQEITPVVSIDSIVCNQDRTTYEIYLKSNFEMIQNDLNAPVIEISNGQFLITDIDISSSITITLTYNGTTCSTEIMADPPNCDCNASADAGPDQILDCYNNGIASLRGLATSQGNGFSYSWLDENGNEVGTADSLVVTQEGVYVLIVNDLVQNCFDSSFVTVVDIRNEPLAVIFANPDTIIDCFVGSVNLSTSIQQNVRYEWYINSAIASQNEFIEVSTASTVTLVAIDTITGCQNESSIEVINNESYPLIFFDPTEELNCIDSVVEINLSTTSSTGGSFVHQWYDINGQLLVGENGTSLSVSQSGLYIIETRDIMNDCIHQDTVEVTANYEFPIIDAGANNSIPCDNSPVQLSASANNIMDYQLSWSTTDGNILSGQQGLNPEVSQGGWYYLQAIHNESGCIALDSVFVDNVPNQIVANVFPNPPSCPGDADGRISVDLIGAAEPIMYTVNGNPVGSNGTFDNLSADTYLIEAVDANGCTFDTSLILNDPNALALELSEDYFEIEGTNIIDLFLLTNASDVDSIIWSDGLKIFCDDCLNPKIEVEESGTYEVSIIDEFGCLASARFQVVIKEVFSIFVPSTFSPNGDGVNDVLFIYTGDNIDEIVKFEIYARWGEQVFSVNSVPPNDPDYGWDGSFLGKDMDPAVFAYYAVLKDINGEEHLVYGDITLIR